MFASEPNRPSSQLRSIRASPKLALAEDFVTDDSQRSAG